MQALVRSIVILGLMGLPTTSFGDELLGDLEELYELTENCSERTEVALRWGMVLRQSPMRSPKRKTLLESVYKKALVPCALESTRAQAIFELGIVAFGDGDFSRAKDLFTQLLNGYREDLLVIDGLYWLGETLSELGELKRARRAYLGVAERSVGEMRGWGLFKSSRLNRPAKVEARNLRRLLDLLFISDDISAKFKRSVADAFASDWARASNQTRGRLRATKRWKRLQGREAASLIRAMGRYFISTSDRYSLNALLVSLRRLNIPGWEFEDRLWTGMLSEQSDWLGWLQKHPELLTEALALQTDSERLGHFADVLEIAIGRSGRGFYEAPQSQIRAVNQWVDSVISVAPSQLFALVKLHQVTRIANEGVTSPFAAAVGLLAKRCLERREMRCASASLPAMLALWSERRPALERERSGSGAPLAEIQLWDALRRGIEGRRLILNREEELAELIELALTFEQLDGFRSFISLIPDDFPDANCEIYRALSSVDRVDIAADFWRETQQTLQRLSASGGSVCRLDSKRLLDRLEARLDLSALPSEESIDELRLKHQGRGGLALILIEDWKRKFEAGNLIEAQGRMTTLLADHGREKEVRRIASEWGDWLERNNNWAGAAEHFANVADAGGKAIAFYALSKAGRAYRLAGNRDASLGMMRKAQERAAQEMNSAGLKKICDYWWRQWLQGDASLAKEVRSCHRTLLQDRLGERCKALTRVWSLEPQNSRADSAFPTPAESVETSDCESARWESFLGGIRKVIDDLGLLRIPPQADEASLSVYLRRLEEIRKVHAPSFRPYLSAMRPVLDSLALAYYYGRFHEALFEGLMQLDDPSLGTSESALWRQELVKRGEPLKAIALSAYQKAQSLRSNKVVHVLEPALQEALLRLEALSSQPALDYLPFPGE